MRSLGARDVMDGCCRWICNEIRWKAMPDDGGRCGVVFYGTESGEVSMLLEA